MTEQRPLSPREVAKKTLESKLWQDISGSNRLRTNPFQYGQLGMGGAEPAYDESMNSEEAAEIRKQMFNERKKEGQGLDIYGEPSQPTNYDVSLRIMRELENSKMLLSLKELEGIVKSVADGFEFSVPDELKGYTVKELQDKAVRAEMAKRTGARAEGLNEKEKDAFAAYNILSQAYDRGVALNAVQSGYFADLNGAAHQISEKYKKKPQKEK